MGEPVNIDPLLAKGDALIAARYNKQLNGKDGAAEPFPLSLIHSAAEFDKLEIPPRESIVDGLMFTKTLTEVFAKRGIGKTMLVLYFAVVLARGDKSFLAWTINKARRVMYVDGEMSGAELQERLRKFAAGSEMPALLDIMASDTFFKLFHNSMNLANIVQQQQFLDMLDELEKVGRLPEVLILDNKSALTFGTEENSTTEQQPFGNFLKALRHRGLTVVIVHHAGKSGEQRGASGFEDPLDLVIKLEAPAPEPGQEPAHQPEGAAFRISFTKHRGQKRPDPYTLDVELMTNEQGAFTWAMQQPRRQQGWLRVLEYLFDHPEATQAAMCRALEIDKSNMSAHVKILRARKFMDASTQQLTASARNYVEAARRGKKAATYDEMDA